MAAQLDFYESALHQRVAHFMKNGIHMTVAPLTTNAEDNPANGFEVFFWGSDKSGKMDTGKVLGDGVVRGGSDDFEEIADTYAQRLDAGIKPEDMFKDIEEQTIRDIKRLGAELAAGRLK